MPYVTTPSNYEAIKPYIQEYSQEIQKKIIVAPHVVVVDTCSFQFFTKANRADSFADWIRHNNACIVIFRTILMELAGDRGSLEAQQISLFEKLHAKRIDSFVLFEEDIKELLQIYTDNNRTNQFLKNAVGCVNGSTSVIRHLLDSNPDIAHALFVNTLSSKPDLYSVFWNALRQQKKHSDSVGEYACIICIHILANIDDINKYKYVFLSEGKPAMQVLSKAINNVGKNDDFDLIGGATPFKNKGLGCR